MHILIINKQYERMKAALPIAYIQYLNQLKKVGKVGHVEQLGALFIQ